MYAYVSIFLLLWLWKILRLQSHIRNRFLHGHTNYSTEIWGRQRERERWTKRFHKYALEHKYSVKYMQQCLFGSYENENRDWCLFTIKHTEKCAFAIEFRHLTDAKCCLFIHLSLHYFVRPKYISKKSAKHQLKYLSGNGILVEHTTKIWKKRRSTTDKKDHALTHTQLRNVEIKFNVNRGKKREHTAKSRLPTNDFVYFFFVFFYESFA